MKRFGSFILATLLTVSMLAGCGQTDTGETEKTSEPEQSSVENTDIPTETEAQDMESESAQSNAPIVYMTTNISPEGLKAVYDALGWQPTGNVAVKLSTGEAGNEYYLSPDLIKGLVQEVDGTIVECNTAYGGSRANTAMHMQVAEDHGFTAIALRVISFSIPVTGVTIILGAVLQSLNNSGKEFVISMERIVILLISALLLSLTGSLEIVWWAFVITEVIALIMGIVFWKKVNSQYIKPLESE